MSVKVDVTSEPLIVELIIDYRMTVSTSNKIHMNILFTVINCL